MNFIKKGAVVFLTIYLINLNQILAQENLVLPDSVSFVDFLKTQGEIPGLHYRLIDLSTGELIDSPFFIQLDSGTVSDYTTVLELKNKLWQLDSSNTDIQFLIYGELNEFRATQEYVSNLLRNGDIIIKGAENQVDEDLISLASRDRYSPMFKKSFAFFSEAKVFIVTLIIILFFFFAAGMILFMWIFKTSKNRKEKLMETYDEEVVGPLSEILFEKTLEELFSLTDEELNFYFPEKQLRKPLYRDILLDRILVLNKEMKGDFKLKLKALYERIGLDKMSMKKLNSSTWDVVVKGLVEINEMNLIVAEPEVKKHANSPNFYIRTQAVATLLHLSDSIDLSFLRDQPFPLSAWQQMNYLRIIKYLYASRELHIDNLFDSANMSVRLFGYKLVRILGVVELLKELEKRFETADIQEKIEIIITFEYLGAPTLSKLINESLYAEDPELLAIAARATGVIGNAESVLIIIDLLKQGPSFNLKMILLKSLKSLDKVLYSQVVTENLDADVQRIYTHLADPLLQDV